MWKRIKTHLDIALLGSTTLVVFFVFQFLWWVFGPDTPVPMWVIMLLLIVFYLCCVMIYAVCKTRTVEVQHRLPRIRNYIKHRNSITLILERNELFADSSYATVYQPGSDTELEIPLAVGVVQITSSPDFMQVRLIRNLEKDLLEELFPDERGGKAGLWKSVGVKPTISMIYLNERINALIREEEPEDSALAENGGRDDGDPIDYGESD